MLRLTREVRFSVAGAGARGAAGAGKVYNAFGGYPGLTGEGLYLRLAVTLTGELDRASQYLVNIRDVDVAVRERVVPYLEEVRGRGGLASEAGWGEAVVGVAGLLRGVFGNAEVEGVELFRSEYFSMGVRMEEEAMVLVSHRFEFSAAHRLHNAGLSEEENRATFGKCNNPLGHGHNYEVKVTVKGRVGGEVVDSGELERVVEGALIRVMDHKFLNLEVEEFKDVAAGGRGVIPSVENIAAVAFGRLKGAIAGAGLGLLASVTVWETPKTWAEYSE